MFNMKRVIYSVDDVDAVASFYEQAFGFARKLDPDFRPEQWSEMVAGDCNLGLYPGGIPKNEQERRVINVVYYTPDLNVARERLTQHGAKIGEIEDRGQFQICNAEDPWGFQFQFSNRESV